MHHSVKYGILPLIALCMSFFQATAQPQEIANPGPNGVFLFLGKTIPAGLKAKAYLVERSENGGKWATLAEVATPATFAEFTARIRQAQSFLPALVIPNDARLLTLYNNARKSGTTDSISGWRLYPVRIGLGIMYYDATARNGSAYSYRITLLDRDGQHLADTVSNTVALPYTLRVDSLVWMESSRTPESVYIKWASTGKKPAPLYMVYRFEEKKPVVASGKFGRYSLNDTTFFTFTDTIMKAFSDQEMQYFVVPFDQFGNAGKSSAVTVIPYDDFEKVAIKNLKASGMEFYGGIKLTWRISNPLPFKKVEVYRSGDPSKGFSLYKKLTPQDTAWIDDNTFPDVEYVYYLKLTSTSGKRFRNSGVVKSFAYYPVKPMAPKVTLAGAGEQGVQLLVEIRDPRTRDVRVFRSLLASQGFTAVTGVVQKIDSLRVIFTDTGYRLPDAAAWYYAARTESPNLLISDLSQPVEFVPEKAGTLKSPAFLKAGIEGKGIRLEWEDARAKDKAVTGYLLVRRENNTESGISYMSPLGNSDKAPLQKAGFTDDGVTKGKTYTYMVQSVDKDNHKSEPGALVTVRFE